MAQRNGRVHYSPNVRVTVQNHALVTFQTLAEASSPAVANRSSYPVLGHQTTVFTSLTSWAAANRAINLWIGGARANECGGSCLIE